MIYLASDYQEGCHPAILAKLQETNFESTPGYGEDAYSESAARKIRSACGLPPDAPVHFVTGGTQANMVVISQALRPYESVVSVSGGHITIHEAGAIEGTGHKVEVLPEHNGKMDPDELSGFLRLWTEDPNRAHLTKPAMVYITQPTEVGSVYSKAELEAIYAVTRKYHLALFIDGARLGYALASEGADFTLSDIAHLCDVFYIGGTKVGALFGEAIVFPDPALARGFFTYRKQRGALLAKGRMLGIQFDVLFSDDLYVKISRHAVTEAMRLRDALIKKGYRFFSESPTNQQFIVLDNSKKEELARQFVFSEWCPVDEAHSAVRFCTSWATRSEDIDQLISCL